MTFSTKLRLGATEKCKGYLPGDIKWAESGKRGADTGGRAPAGWQSAISGLGIPDKAAVRLVVIDLAPGHYVLYYLKGFC